MMPYLLAAAAAEPGLAEKFGLEVRLVVFQLIGFLIFFVVVYKWGIKPVVATMDQRKRQIADGLKFEEEMRAKLADAQRQHAEALKQAAQEAQKLVDEARTAAKELLDRESKQATERAQQIIAKAQEAIELDRRKMLADAREEISRLVALTASRVLSRELNSDERRRYADAAARELTNV